MNGNDPAPHEHCAICDCVLHRNGGYGRPTYEARSHASEHHLVAERFFGRSANRRGTLRDSLFPSCPWNSERVLGVFCYECHEIMLHNPVLLPEDLSAFAALVRERNLHEDTKPTDYEKIAARIQLFHEIIAAGLRALSNTNERSG
jgi:hypothetical protein